MNAREPPDEDPLHESSRPDLHWTTANVGEALPGVMTPLGWSLWGPTIERTTRVTLHAIGAFTRAESVSPASVDGRLLRIFRGRAALQVETLATLGDRMPGTTGEQVVAGVFGVVPDDLTFSPTRRRYPAVAVGLPRQLLAISGRLERARAETETWWLAGVDAVPELDLRDAVGAFEDATKRFYANVLLQTIALFAAVQPLYDALTALVKRTGVGDATALCGGYGGVPETAVVTDLWRVSRGELDIESVVRSHGYHGPLEGEISGRVWREDDSPLRRMSVDYAQRGDERDPRLREAERQTERAALERELIVATPRLQRPAVKALLGVAARSIPLRGAAKGAFLQALDMARASARRTGGLLAADGVLDDPEDVFMLTVDELIRALPAGVKPLVKVRRAHRAEHSKLVLPSTWTGMPDARPADPDQARASGVMRGNGVSGGVATGRVRVVTDPTFAEVETDEILVAPTTDPSWSSIMFLSSALVVDIGGALSHAAVVARELGIPCVVNTRDGSRSLRTGDRVCVDGTAGTVEVLEHAPPWDELSPA